MRQTRTQMSALIRIFSFLTEKKSFLNQTEKVLGSKRTWFSFPPRMFQTFCTGFFLWVPIPAWWRCSGRRSLSVLVCLSHSENLKMSVELSPFFSYPVRLERDVRKHNVHLAYVQMGEMWTILLSVIAHHSNVQAQGQSLDKDWSLAFSVLPWCTLDFRHCFGMNGYHALPALEESLMTFSAFLLAQ